MQLSKKTTYHTLGTCLPGIDLSPAKEVLAAEFFNMKSAVLSRLGHWHMHMGVFDQDPRIFRYSLGASELPKTLRGANISTHPIKGHWKMKVRHKSPYYTV